MGTSGRASRLCRSLTRGGQVPISISWSAAGPGGFRCLGMVARPYVKDARSGPIFYLDLAASARRRARDHERLLDPERTVAAAGHVHRHRGPAPAAEDADAVGQAGAHPERLRGQSQSYAVDRLRRGQLELPGPLRQHAQGRGRDRARLRDAVRGERHARLFAVLPRRPAAGSAAHDDLRERAGLRSVQAGPSLFAAKRARRRASTSRPALRTTGPTRRSRRRRSRIS